MNTTTHPTSDLEALSALFDGELAGDPARFALKRLDHDQAWRSTCERWSLVGDVLRGQGQALLPAGFPARVRETSIAPAPVAATERARRWATWGGAGLAASVAAVALFFAREATEVEAPVEASPLVATVPRPAADTPAVAAHAGVAAAARPPVPRPQGGGAVQLASAGLAIAEGTRLGTQRVRGTQRTRTVPSAPARRATSPALRVPQTAVAAAPLLPPPSGAATPFADQAAARPWPRPVLPQFAGSGALTTDFGAASPSFYPFEPRLPDEATDDAATTGAPAH